MKVRVLYFARLREQLGSAGEDVEFGSDIATVGQLRATLAARGGAWQEALEGQGARRLRIAVNQDIATPETPLRGGEEVAFFPPVTGG